MDPPPARRQDPWGPTVAKLIEHTGQWALVYEAPYNEANKLRGRIAHRRGSWAGHLWEVTTRKVPDSHPEQVQVFARHMGPLPDAHGGGE